MSHSHDFFMTRDQIITRALQIIGAIDPGQDPDTDQIDTAALELNMLLKSYVNEGYLPWKYETLVLFPEPPKYARYDIYSGASAREWTTEDKLGWVEVTTDTSGSSFNSILVKSSSDSIYSPFNPETISVGDRLGIRMDDTDLAWRTVSSIGFVGDDTQINLDSSVEGSIEEGDRVYFFTPPRAHTLHQILNVTRRDDNDHDTPLHHISFKDYQWLTRKATQPGTPVQYSYRQDVVMDDGAWARQVTHFYLWPPPKDATYRFYILGTRLFHDLNEAEDTPDIPQEWLLALTWELASNLSIEYALDTEHENAIARKAGMFKEKALSASAEGSYIKFEPDLRFGDY